MLLEGSVPIVSPYLSLLVSVIPLVATILYGYLLYNLSKKFVNKEEIDEVKIKIKEIGSVISGSATIKDRDDLMKSLSKMSINHNTIEKEIALIKQQLSQRELAFQESIRNLEKYIKLSIESELKIINNKIDGDIKNNRNQLETIVKLIEELKG